MLAAFLQLGLMAVLLIGAPGPAAMALIATGSSSRFRQGLPLIIGLVVGVLLTGLLTNIGMSALLSRWPDARLIMQIIGAVFILIMAIKLIRPPPIGALDTTQIVFGFKSGVLMNILNPKAYAVFMLLISKFMPALSTKLLSIIMLEMVTSLATITVGFGWLLVGRFLGRIANSSNGEKYIRFISAGLMIVFVMPIIISMPSH